MQRRLSFFLNRNLCRAEAAVMVFVIHHAELSGCYALYQLFSMYDE